MKIPAYVVEFPNGVFRAFCLWKSVNPLALHYGSGNTEQEAMDALATVLKTSSGKLVEVEI